METPERRYIESLKYPERTGIPAETALAKLRHVTGQDFGYDAQAWEDWAKSP